MEGITLNRQAKNRLNKLLEGGDIKIDRNLSARHRLSQKFADRNKPDQSSAAASSASSAAASSASSVSTRSLWDDPGLKRLVDSMDPEMRYKYSQVGEELFKTGGTVDQITRNIVRDPQTAVFESAAQIELMLRDGLDPEELTDEEKMTLVAAIGPEDAKEKYGVVHELKISFLPENEQATGDGIRDDTTTD